MAKTAFLILAATLLGVRPAAGAETDPLRVLLSIGRGPYQYNVQVPLADS